MLAPTPRSILVAATLAALSGTACGDGATGPTPTPNRAPLPNGSVPVQTVTVGQTTTLDLAGYFTDPDGDALTYAAASSHIEIASVSVAGSVLAIVGVAKGATTITVTASDDDGATAQQAFDVTVPNQPPTSVDTIPAVTVAVDSTATVDAAAYFSDPDGDGLVYTASSSDSSRVTVSVTGSAVAIAGVAKGAVTVTVTASDSNDATAQQAFAVTVPNRPPEPVDTIPAVTVAVDSTATVDASGYFSDPDSDELGYAASSSDSSRVTVSVAGSAVTIAGVSKGAATITITATDSDSATALQAFAVTVPNRPPAALDSIPAVTMADATAVVDVANWFADPDGEPLTYTARSMDTTVARIAAVSGSVVHLVGGRAGKAGLEATATDSEGLSARATVVVTVFRDRDALAALHRATGGRYWRRADNWLTDAPLSEWYGVNVDSAGRVAALDLYGNGLSASIPSEIGDLTALKLLDLGGNSLIGSIPPEIGKLAALESLSIVYKGLDYRGRKRLSGPIPPEIGNLAALRELHLYGNDLSGPIPPEVGKLVSLESLNLEDTRLSGPIPPEIGNLAALELLSLSNDRHTGELTGPIPPEIGKLRALKGLYLYGNDLSGPIPREIGNLSALEYLWLSTNRIGGLIPPEIGNLSALRSLTLSGNRLSGPIPPEMANLTASTSGLSPPSNPNLCAPDSPRLLAWLAARHEQPRRCAMLGGYHREALTALYIATNGPNWKRSDNWRTNAPLGEWYGISADAAGRVVSVELSDNGLAGPIPTAIGNLAATLEVLDLSGNALTGRLVVNGVRREGSIPPEIGELIALESLHLGDNALTGPIPTAMANLAALKVLDLGGNPALCTPDSPRFVEWLAALYAQPPRRCAVLAGYHREALAALYRATDGPNWGRDDNWLTDAPLSEWRGVRTDSDGRVVSLYLAENGLSGSIPPEIGNLAAPGVLTLLSLHGNDLGGPIPAEIGNLVSLMRLDLRNNRLTGPIPLEMANLVALKVLDLDGNPGLCTPNSPRLLAWLAKLNVQPPPRCL